MSILSSSSLYSGMSRMGDVRSIDCRNRVYQIVTFGEEIDENRLYKLSGKIELIYNKEALIY